MLALHRAKYLHRDLKLLNVFIKQDGHIAIGDFGLAAPFEADHTPVEAGTWCGTLSHMAPETWQGKGWTTAADWWSVGVMLYHMLHGEVCCLHFLSFQSVRLCRCPGIRTASRRTTRRCQRQCATRSQLMPAIWIQRRSGCWKGYDDCVAWSCTHSLDSSCGKIRLPGLDFITSLWSRSLLQRKKCIHSFDLVWTSSVYSPWTSVASGTLSRKFWCPAL